ncbi:hypothetical protein MAR_025036 [Mya arenaria]|uniref:Uncharacterized protein n=1 Tax=Mya arenaria TaxID=6604 RepID=A0ABY7DX29_MYAAR|nr:hypothetical protein MAR_025036 [Mya arenaria]
MGYKIKDFMDLDIVFDLIQSVSGHDIDCNLLSRDGLHLSFLGTETVASCIEKAVRATLRRPLRDEGRAVIGPLLYSEAARSIVSETPQTADAPNPCCAVSFSLTCDCRRPHTISFPSRFSDES